MVKNNYSMKAVSSMFLPNFFFLKLFNFLKCCTHCGNSTSATENLQRHNGGTQGWGFLTTGRPSKRVWNKLIVTLYTLPLYPSEHTWKMLYIRKYVHGAFKDSQWLVCTKIFKKHKSIYVRTFDFFFRNIWIIYFLRRARLSLYKRWR